MIRGQLLPLLFLRPCLLRCGVSLRFVFTACSGTTKYEKFVLGCIVLGLVGCLGILLIGSRCLCLDVHASVDSGRALGRC